MYTHTSIHTETINNYMHIHTHMNDTHRKHTINQEHNTSINTSKIQNTTQHTINTQIHTHRDEYIHTSNNQTHQTKQIN